MAELTEYEYFESAPLDPEREEMQAYFLDVIDYAYFAVKFGWTKEEYEQLTHIERRFIRKEIETATVRDSELFQQIIEQAIGNSFRKKGKKYRKLFKKLKKDLSQPIAPVEFAQLATAIKKKFKQFIA